MGSTAVDFEPKDHDEEEDDVLSPDSYVEDLDRGAFISPVGILFRQFRDFWNVFIEKK